MAPLILGLAGPVPNLAERTFFREVDPAGFILFARNVVDPAQIRTLTDDLRTLSGRADVPILVDQEGGRVARLRPPAFPAFPPQGVFDRLYEISAVAAIEAARANAMALAAMLREAGITVDCLPLLDVRDPHGHDIIGDRALGADPLRVAALGRAVLEGLLAGGVAGVVKHMPGHGRARVDSHQELPVVDASTDELDHDLAPFIRLNHAAIGMTAHVVFTAWDPARPASLSPTVIGEVIRGRIGFDGLLLSDDLGMNALAGDFGARAAGVIAAGCDIALHCSGDLAEMEAVAGAVGTITPRAHARLERAVTEITRPVDDSPLAELVRRRDALLARLVA